MKERLKFLVLVGVFAFFYFLPADVWTKAPYIAPGFVLLREYARAHVLTCLVPAFFIAGAIAVYLNKDSVLKYLGPAAHGYISYPLASLSGGVLAVCSCTVLPLFAGLYKRGAGLGPAIAFVFTGPAINITAIFLTVSVLGWQFAAFRLGAAMIIAITAGVIMASVFERAGESAVASQDWSPSAIQTEPTYSGSTIGLFLGSQVGLLILLSVGSVPILAKLILTLFVIAVVVTVSFIHFRPDDRSQWMDETWTFTKQIIPYLFAGVFLAGLLSAILPADVVSGLVGGNGIEANAIAAVSGALMYFATLTEIPILQSLMDMGMGSGPAMALLLTGNALSLPNLIVLHKIIGRRKMVVYLTLTVSLSIIAGLIFGILIR